MDSSIYCNPVAANGVLYITIRNRLIAIESKKPKKDLSHSPFASSACLKSRAMVLVYAHKEEAWQERERLMLPKERAERKGRRAEREAEAAAEKS